MGETNLGKVRGATWYDGTGITGNSTTPTIFSGSGVTKAYVGDYYLNTDPGTDGGNVYCCTTKGDADTAKWAYVGNIRGLQPEIVNNLNSDSTTKALSAAQGKALKQMIIDAGLYATRVLPKSAQTAYTAAVTIENKTTTLGFDDDTGNSGTYSYTKTGDNETAVVTVSIGTSIGLPNTGAVITAIDSSSAAIISYVLYDNDSIEIFSDAPALWEHINDCDEDVLPGGTISESHAGTSYTYKDGKISKLIDAVRTALYPITHAKAVWFNKAANKTVHDAFTDVMGTSNVFNPATTYAAGDAVIYGSAVYKFTAAHTGAWTGSDVTKLDLSTISTHKIDTNKIANNLTTTTGGYVLDARQGKVLNDAVVNKADKAWTLAGYKQGANNPVALPAVWNELDIYLAYSGTLVCAHIVKGMYGVFYCGANIAGWVGGSFSVTTGNTAYLNNIWHNGSLVTASSLIYVYYK